MFHPAPQPAVGASPTGVQRYPSLAANDAAGSKRRGRYNWDGRYIGKPADDRDRPSLTHRVLLPAGGLVLLAGVALGAFYLMHTFAIGSAPAVTGPTPAVATAQMAAAATPLPKAEAAPNQSPGGAAAGQDVAGRVASSGKEGAVSSGAVATAKQSAAVAAANIKVPAPDNARWGEAPDARPSTAPAGQAEAPKAQAAAPQPEAPAGRAEAAPEVKDPQSAPVPTEAPKKLAYASPEQAPAHPVDKAVTASLPPVQAQKDTTPPGVDPNPLSVPAKASADAAQDDVAGGHLSTVKTDVRLHSGPSNGTSSLGVVPDKATVHVLSCKGWCKVSYNGRQGYIFKSFLGGATAPAKAASAKAAPASAQVAAPAQEPQKKTANAADAQASPSDMEAAGQQTMSRGR